MAERPESEPVEPVESVQDGYNETQPASADDVDRAREHEEILGSTPRRDADRSLTGETHRRPTDEPVERPAPTPDADRP